MHPWHTAAPDLANDTFTPKRNSDNVKLIERPGRSGVGNESNADLCRAIEVACL